MVASHPASPGQPFREIRPVKGPRNRDAPRAFQGISKSHLRVHPAIDDDSRDVRERKAAARHVSADRGKGSRATRMPVSEAP